MDEKKLWKKASENIKNQIQFGAFRTWFQEVRIDKLEQDKVIMAVPSAFSKENIPKRYLSMLESVFEELLGKKVTVDFVIKASTPKPKPISSGAEEKEGEFFQPEFVNKPLILNPKYTLSNFVVGLTNNLAFAAAQAVTQNPGTSYNPLFIYGGTGVGKTHLMVGIGNAILKQNPESKIIYCSSEKFMNDYVTAIQQHKMGEFRNKYRSADILLMDDVQFFSGREGTQEEFFHTFNELQAKNAQIVMTSDKIPNEIAKLEDRLKSRFVGGLMIDIQPPDFDTRVAILRAKCLEKGDMLPDETLKLLASSLGASIRELEGKLIQILQVIKFKNLDPTPENIAILLNKTTTSSLKSDPKQILNAICSYFSLNMKDLTGPRRQKELVMPRHIAMFLLSEELNITVEKVGDLLGGRDHTTVMHGRDKIKELQASDSNIQRTITEIKQKLSN